MATSVTKTLAQRAVGKLTPSSCTLLLCDIQERFRPLIHNTDTIVQTAQYMTSVAKALDMKIVGTEQYPKVFGRTLKDCFKTEEELKSTPIFEKKLFSMITEEVMDHLELWEMVEVHSFVLVGIEAHVCVQQTCLDLLEMGHDVHIVVDGVSSQQAIDREVALQRMANAGAYLTTAQSVAYMLMKSANNPNLKAVSKLTVEHMKLPNEFNDALKGK